ncbi:MAG: inositol monophosphatase [Desulfovibrionaceae bacterium]|nr:inositol monophosphatase [Desulfovibrionaceae bacterium]MBF0514071.1 inositol monophosphatase [Desulfovibrionaceae bacterium]
MPLKKTELDRIAAKARLAVLAAGEIIREHFVLPKDVRRKGRIDLVTATDLAVEKALMHSLAEVLPGCAFLAEETAGHTALDRPTWIIDPVDGTTNFAHQIPFVATSVALWAEGEIALAVVNAPILGECFTAQKGGAAFVNDRPLRVSTAAEPENALVATGFPYTIRDDVDRILPPLRAMLLATRGVRRQGAASIDLAYVAAGRFDAFYEIGLKPWDTAAGLLLVAEAGGMVSRFDGQTPYALGDPDILASNGRLHPDMARLIAG